MKVTHNLNRTYVKYEDAPAGSFCLVIKACDSSNEGRIIKKPFCNNQAVVFMDKNIASTDIKCGIREVYVLQDGDKFEVTV